MEHLGQEYDEDELEQELEALEQEELDNQLIGVGTSANELPEVPSGELKEPATTPKEKEKKKGLCVCEIDAKIRLSCIYYLFSFRRFFFLHYEQYQLNQPKMMTT